VVLVRYVGCPIAPNPLARLGDADALGAYTKARQKISLSNSLGVHFMRQNILHFIYAMSGKINLIQLPEIESTFASAFPLNLCIFPIFDTV
jgi:hypothetical protein